MSISLEREKWIGGSGYIRTIPCFQVCDPPPAIIVASPAVAEASQSSSIGRNSNFSSAVGVGGQEGGEAEVQSSYKGPLETMDALEESLSIRRGISKFYCGKSRSFASLSDAMFKLSSSKELGKPDNPYNRKRKSLLLLSTRLEQPAGEDSASKRPANFSGRISAAPAILPSSSSSSSISNSSGEGKKKDRFRQSLLPLHPNGYRNASLWPSPLPPENGRLSFPARSFMLVDFLGMENLRSSVSSSSSSICSEKK